MAEAVWPLYRDTFGGFQDTATFRTELFDRHQVREGFVLAIARDDEQVVGFSWGYIGRRGQFWSDLVAQALPREIVDAWVGGHFELVELAVAESHRGQGLGRLLHDNVLAGLHRKCLLSTVDDISDPVVRLYRDAGWLRLGTLREGVQVMGRKAPSPS